MNPEDTSPLIDDWVKIMIIIFIAVILFEGTIFAIAYFNADEIECNLLWCSFKTVRGNSTISQECFQNGLKINCSEMPDIDWHNGEGRVYEK